MLSTTTQISFRNTLDSVLTWASLKPTSKPHPEDGCNSTRRRRRSRDIFSVLVTPDRIPKFIIPPLDVEHHLCPRVEQEPGVGGEEIGAGGRRLMSPGSRGVTVGGSGDGGARRDPSRRRERLCGKPKSSLLSGELQGEPDHSDPTTRAALSLPHLQKITTPYGFLALGESPSIRRKESLFFEIDSAELRALLGSRRKSPALARSHSSPLTLLQQRRQQQDKGGPINSSPAPVVKVSRSASWDLLVHPSRRVPGSPSASPAPSPSHYRTSFLKDKSKFQVLIKKHFSNIKRMRSSSSSSIERFLVPVDRALSNPNP